MKNLDRIGNKVFGDGFVGRKNLIRQLQDCCTSQNFSVVGLPKIGKSSLVYHSIIYNKRDVRRNNYRPFIPVFVDCGPASSIQEFFNNITISVYNELQKVLPDERRQHLLNDYSEYNNNVINNLSISVMGFFNTLMNYQIDIVIILDDFDRVRTIKGFDGTRLAIIRTLSELAYIKFIIISKRHLSIIENWNEDPSHNPSNLFQCFKEIIVGNFDVDEWNIYWDRVFLDHSDIIIEDRKRIKEEAFHYTGFNPFWTAFFARCYVDSLKYNSTFNNSMRQVEMTRCAYFPMKEFLCDDKNYKNNILDTAIQAITGPVYKLNLVDITTLEQYGFLTHINCDKKNNIFGNDWGCRFYDNDTPKSYIASSVHFTSFLIREFTQATYWQEWDYFFKKWHSLLSHFELSYNISMTVINQHWESEFNPVFNNNSFQWFSTRFNHILGYKCKEKSELPINEENIDRVNNYLTELTNMIEKYLKQFV